MTVGSEAIEEGGCIGRGVIEGMCAKGEEVGGGDGRFVEGLFEEVDRVDVGGEAFQRGDDSGEIVPTRTGTGSIWGRAFSVGGMKKRLVCSLGSSFPMRTADGSVCSWFVVSVGWVVSLR